MLDEVAFQHATNTGKSLVLRWALSCMQSLAGNLRSKNTLTRPNMRVCAVNENGSIVHEENVFR